MKKVLLLAVAMMATISAFAQDGPPATRGTTNDFITSVNMEAAPGDVIPVIFTYDCTENADTYVGCQFDVKYPNGIKPLSTVFDEEEDTDVPAFSILTGKNGACNSNAHQIAGQDHPEDNFFRVMIYPKNAIQSFKAEPKAIIQWYFQVAEDATGEYTIDLDAVVFSSDPKTKNVTYDAKGKSFKISVVPTGISNVATAKADKALYDLQGRRVNNAAKGVFIKGGKKVLVK